MGHEWEQWYLAGNLHRVIRDNVPVASVDVVAIYGNASRLRLITEKDQLD